MKRTVKITLKSFYNIDVEDDTHIGLINKAIEKLPKNLNYDSIYYEIEEVNMDEEENPKIII